MTLRIATALSLALAAGCGDVTPPAPLAPAAPHGVPIVVVIGDSTAVANGVPVITQADLVAATDRLVLLGGELAVGRVADAAGTPFESAPFETPAPRPTGNGLVAKRLLARWQVAEAARITRNTTTVGPFTKRSITALTARSHQRRSDIWAQVARAVTFLEQPRAEAPVRKVLIFVTDGIHNAATRRCQLPRDVDVLVVHGPGGAGVLEGVKTASFSSVAAALAHATAEKERPQ